MVDPSAPSRPLAEGAFVLGALLERTKTHALHRATRREGRGRVVVRVVEPDLAEDEAFRARFLAEASAAARLEHPNLARVLACGREPDGLLWVASEDPEGQTLRERLTAEGPIATSKLVPLALQICEALDAAHAVGLVHRDVRPENVVLAVEIDRSALPRIVAKVREIGFGLGRRLASGLVAAGAPEYMSPEQCRGDEDLDVRSDVYAFGILLYELVTGQVPFASDKPIVVVNRQLSMAPPPPSELRPGLDPRLEAVLARALRKARDDRYASMAELAEDVRALLEPLAMPAVTLPPPPVAPTVAPSIPPVPRVAAPAPRVAAAPAPVPARAQVSVPVSVPRAAPAARPSTRPDWLEDAGTSHSNFLQGLRTGAPAPVVDVTESVRRDPKAYAAKLVALEDVRAFLAEMRALEAAMPKLVAAADARSLWAVSSALQGIATEGKAEPGSRASLAARALAWFYDPRVLGRVAEKRLADGDAAAHTLLVRAGARGAHALYGARVKAADRPAARAPFVETLRAIGVSGWPVVKAALERMPEAALEGRHPAGTDLAEDMLASLPALPEAEGLEAVLLRYLRANVPSLAEGASRTFARSLPAQAGPVLAALLEDAREGARIAALVGLRELGAVEGAIVAKLAPIVRREVPATPALRLAAIAALRAVAQEARAEAAPLLVGIVRKGARGEDRIVLAAAEALLSMLGNQARAVVLECVDRSEEPLRTELTALLADPVLEIP